ncbi:Endolytic peptidoglycan transglycosylase RlpA [Erythrobacter sp. EC-HK427]|nr:Endolytic peptidoglycan transglycosylase RlpA [Erythrobacter sp. EC-HK427]
MNGMEPLRTPRAKRLRAKGRASLALAALALLGAAGVGQAQQSPQQASQRAPLAATHSAPAGAPVFTPSPEAAFEETFARYADPGAVAIPAHAVDIATIEPATPPAAEALGSGVASYYGRQFHGRRTANGETFDMNALTAAHRTLPFGSRVRVTNTGNGRSVIVRINDRGPFTRGRTIDLSQAAATEIGLIQRGHGTVQLELLRD